MPHHVFIIWMNPPLCPEQVSVIVWAGGHYHCYVTRAIPSPALGQTQEEAQPIFNCVFILASFPGLPRLQFCILQVIKNEAGGGLGTRV